MITETVTVALGIGSGAFIVSLAQVSQPLRFWVLQKSNPAHHRWRVWKWLFQLLSCPFCVSVWMSLAAVGIYQPRLVRYFWPVGYLTVSLAVSSTAMLAVLIIKQAVGK